MTKFFAVLVLLTIAQCFPLIVEARDMTGWSENTPAPTLSITPGTMPLKPDGNTPVTWTVTVNGTPEVANGGEITIIGSKDGGPWNISGPSFTSLNAGGTFNAPSNEPGNHIINGAGVYTFKAKIKVKTATAYEDAYSSPVTLTVRPPVKVYLYLGSTSITGDSNVTTTYQAKVVTVDAFGNETDAPDNTTVYFDSTSPLPSKVTLSTTSLTTAGGLTSTGTVKSSEIIGGSNVVATLRARATLNNYTAENTAQLTLKFLTITISPAHTKIYKGSDSANHNQTSVTATVTVNGGGTVTGTVSFAVKSGSTASFNPTSKTMTTGNTTDIVSLIPSGNGSVQIAAVIGGIESTPVTVQTREVNFLTTQVSAPKSSGTTVPAISGDVISFFSPNNDTNYIVDYVPGVNMTITVTGGVAASEPLAAVTADSSGNWGGYQQTGATRRTCDFVHNPAKPALPTGGNAGTINVGGGGATDFTDIWYPKTGLLEDPLSYIAKISYDATAKLWTLAGAVGHGTYGLSVGSHQSLGGVFENKNP